MGFNQQKPAIFFNGICIYGGKTMPFVPPVTGTGKHTTYKNVDDWGMVQMALF